MSTTALDDDLPPLRITCTSSDCESNLHCFRTTKKLAPEQRGRCRHCGADLIDWDRVRAQELGDVAHTFESLKIELIRHYFWHRDIDPKAVNYARRKGRVGLRDAAERRIRSSVGAAQAYLFRDGTQTPMDGPNILYYAQHATASCCRTCIEEWHGIPRDRDLRNEEVMYLVELVLLYVAERLPDLDEHGVKIPPVRRSKLESGGQ